MPSIFCLSCFIYFDMLLFLPILEMFPVVSIQYYVSSLGEV